MTNNKDELKCPFCGFESDICDFPDLFTTGTHGYREQFKLLQELQQAGYNLVTCGMCGDVFIQKSGAKNGK